MRAQRSRLVTLSALLCLGGGVGVVGGIAGIAGVQSVQAVAPASPAPGAGLIKDEHLRPAPRGVGSPGVYAARIAAMPMNQAHSEIPPRLQSRARAMQATQATATGDPSLEFLTRPYTTWHVITSIFDHCNPDYSVDGRVCQFDGSVGLKANGVDPYFSLGYAQTPGGGNYLYYDGHNGWDYGLSYENVLAAAPGVVRLAGTDSVNPCFGQTIIVDHPNGFSTRYAHLSAIYVGPTQVVARGQVIGVSGNTGCSTGPHLHFGVYVTSTWTAVDPWGWWGAPGADPWPSDPGDLWLTGSGQFPLPYAPTSVTAVAGNGTAFVSWTPPSFDGGTPISSYTVVASPGGATATAPGTATTAIVTGLTNGTSYTFSVTALNSVGASQSAASNAVTPTGWFGHYRSVGPVRLLDTRTGLGGTSGPVSPGQVLQLPIAGLGGVPATGASAVIANLTATDPRGGGYLTAYPAGSPRPMASSLNFVAGQTVANLAIIPIGVGGAVDIFNGGAPADVLLDVVGYESTDLTTGQGLYHALTAARLLDTRVGGGPIGPNQAVDLQVAGHGGVPASGVGAVLLNLTTTGPSDPSYLTAYPSRTARPQTSSLNFVAGQTVANRAVVALGANGSIAIYNAAGRVNVIVDVSGWLSDATASAGPGAYTGAPMARLLDTRSGSPIPQGETLIDVAGHGGVPAMGAPGAPAAVIVEVTAVAPSAAGFLAVHASGVAWPGTSDLNFRAGQTVCSLAIVPLGSDGRISVYNSAGTTHLILDVVGWIS